MSYQKLIPDETRIRLAEYLKALQSGAARAGARLTDGLHGQDLTTLSEAVVLVAVQVSVVGL